MLFLGGGVFGVAVAGLLLPDVLITRVVGLMFGMTCVMVLKIKNLI